jgi:hypothetical protein
MEKLTKAADDEDLIRQLATNTNPKLLSKLQRRLNAGD